MRLVPVSFMILLVLSMTTSSALMGHPQEPVPQAFAQSSEDSIRDLGNYVVFGFDEVELKKEVTVISGSVGVQNKKSEVEIGKEVTFEDPNSALVGDEVEIDKKAVVQDVYYNELKNKGDIQGTENTPLALPVIDRFPILPEFLPGDESIKVKKGESLSLPPGNYDKIKVKKQGTLIFEGGTYHLSSLKAEKETTILFEDATEIIVDNKIKIGKKSFFGPSESSGLSASDVLIFGVGKERESHYYDDDDDDMDYGDDEEKDDDKSKDDKKKTKIKFKKESIIFANIFAPNGKIEIGKEVHATGSFVANKIKVEKESTLELDSKLGLVSLEDEYVDLISKFDSIGQDIVETEVTSELIESITADLTILSESVIELQLLGFDGIVTTEIIDDKTVGIVSFFNKETSEPLFETQIPDGTLAIFYAFGLIQEFSENGVEISPEHQEAIIVSSLEFVQALTSIDDEQISSALIIASVAAFHPSTGQTLICGSIISCLQQIGKVISKCLNRASCLETVQEIFEKLAEFAIDEAYRLAFPEISVDILKFHDLDVSGTYQVDNEPLLGGWEFTIFALEEIDPFDPFSFIASVNVVAEGVTVPNEKLSFSEIKVPRYSLIISITEFPQVGWVLTSPEGVSRDLPFNADIDTPNLGDVKVYPQELFGNVEEGTEPPEPPIIPPGIDNIYLADIDTEALYKYDSQGNFIKRYVDDRFIEGVGVDSQDNVYAVGSFEDVSGDRFALARFDSNLEIVELLAPQGSPVDPSLVGFGGDVAFDSSDNIYLADIDTEALYKYDSQGNFIKRYVDDRFIEGVGVDSQDNVYAVGSFEDVSGDRFALARFDSNLEIVELLAPQGSPVDPSLVGFGGDVAFGGTSPPSTPNNAYVVDDDGTVHKFDTNGNFIKRWDNPVSGMSIAINSLTGDVFTIGDDNISDNWVYQFDSDGNFIKSFAPFADQFPASPGTIRDAEDIAIDPSGNVYVVDDDGTVHKFDTNGNFIKRWDNPVSGMSIAINSLTGDVFTIGDDNISDNWVYQFDSDGNFIKSFAPFADQFPASPGTIRDAEDLAIG